MKREKKKGFIRAEEDYGREGVKIERNEAKPGPYETIRTTT